VLDLVDDWVWDFWTADDGSAYHLFFLKASRSLGDPDLRHHNASVGHAVSTDLVSWTRVPDALVPQQPAAYDDLATWTGSVALGEDGLWWMFTSGISQADGIFVQRIGVSTSDDLLTWTRRPGPPLVSDPTWYAVRGDDVPVEQWRDPFVVRDEDGLWHMYLTAATSGRGPVPSGTPRHPIWSAGRSGPR